MGVRGVRLDRGRGRLGARVHAARGSGDGVARGAVAGLAAGDARASDRGLLRPAGAFGSCARVRAGVRGPAGRRRGGAAGEARAGGGGGGAAGAARRGACAGARALLGPRALARGEGRDAGVGGRHGSGGAACGRRGAGRPGERPGAAHAECLPGRDEERGGGAVAAALRRAEPDADVVAPGPGAAAVHRARAGRERAREPGAAGAEARAGARGRGAGAALHDGPGASRGRVRGAVPGSLQRARGLGAEPEAQRPGGGVSGRAGGGELRAGEPALLLRRGGA